MTRPPVLLCALLAVILWSAPVTAQYLYFSNGPNLCYPGGAGAGDYHVYVHSPDDDGFTGATFTLELGPFGWNNLVSYTPAPGVQLLKLDMAPGTGISPLTAVVELQWTQRTLDHEPVVTFTFTGPGGPASTATIYDANLSRPGGGSDPATGVTTEFIMVDCIDPSIGIDVPSVVIVPAGSQSTTPFAWNVLFWGVVGSDLILSDELGWLQSWSPSAVWGGGNCGNCLFEWAPGTFTVLVPAGTAPGTESILTIDAPEFDCVKTVTLRADAPVPVQPSTWGRIKSLYR